MGSFRRLAAALLSAATALSQAPAQTRVGVPWTGKAVANCSYALQRQMSSSRCMADGSGISHSGCLANRTMWVEDGCRGYFICDGQPNVYCAAGLHQRTVCPCVSGPPPPRPPPSPPPWPECGVNPATGGCAAPCPAIPNKTACEASPYRCVWTPRRGGEAGGLEGGSAGGRGGRGGGCGDPLPCERITAAAACAASPHKCGWVEGRGCNLTTCNFNGTWNMTFPFGNPAGKVGGGMHFADMHIYQPPGSANFSMEWRTGHCVLPDCYKGRARATGYMRSSTTMQTKNGTAPFMWGVDTLGTGAASPYPSELDKSTPAPPCSLLTFPGWVFEGRAARWCRKPFCPPDSPPADAAAVAAVAAAAAAAAGMAAARRPGMP